MIKETKKTPRKYHVTKASGWLLPFLFLYVV